VPAEARATHARDHAIPPPNSVGPHRRTTRIHPRSATEPDAPVLTHATAEGRAVVTRNIKDFINLDSQYRANNSTHAGLVLVPTKTFPEDRYSLAALVRALDKLLTQGGLDSGAVVFLQR
jgi:hypothetical protein